MVAFDGSAESQGTDTLTFTYDPFGRPDEVARGSTVLTGYAWNPDGSLQTRTDGSHAALTFSYDWAQRLTSLTSPHFSGTLTYTWRNDGLLAARGWPGGAPGAAAFSYDAAKRPIEMEKSGTAAGSLAQAYDRDGNVVSESRSLTGVSGDAGSDTQTFSYDGANRVSLASGLTTSSTYLYDRDSNRTEVATGGSALTSHYDRTGQLINIDDGVDTEAFSYDEYGNLEQSATDFDAVTTYAYDAGDRLVSITTPAQATTSFGFDALGRHASRTLPSSVVEAYAYVGSTETAWLIDDGAAPIRATLDPGGARVAVEDDGVDGFALPDLHGNTAAVVNAAETAYLSATRYDAYGLTADGYDSGTGFTDRWGFQGRLDLSPDPANPLYEFSARFYSPALGVFTQLDSYPGDAADPLSLNRYLYAAANPWTLIDPTGHKFEAGAGTGTMTRDQYRHQVNRRVAAVTAAARHAAQIGREEQLCRCEINNQGINPLGVVGTVLRTGGGVVVRQAQNLAALPGAAVHLVASAPGAIAAAPGAVADFARDPGGSWDRASTAAIVDFRDWVVNTRADILSGDPDRMASGFSASIDVAGLVTGVGAIRGGFRRTAPSPDAAPITERLQGYTTTAANTFDSAPSRYLTPRQAAAVERSKGLYPMFRGQQIDRMAKQLAAGDPHLATSGVSISWGRGPDFVRVATSEWWDMTTTGQWTQHLDRYDNFGYFLDTAN